jgi:Skp family chaperone for outer membrane proteins
MAGNSVIGALRVNLGIDSAEFTAGLKKAQSGLAGFGKTAAVGFAAAATAAVAAGTALAFAGKSAIDAADNLSKAAQKAGVTTEALSRLKYAADFSDVSLETLSGGLQKLSKNMADVASGKGGSAATALSALGISVQDASGVLRNSDVVFADIADKFSRLEDGSTKTALAIQLFGRSGADLIPLLNSGRDGLRQMADESDRLGLTISTSTGRAAEQFNDTLTKVGKILDGVAMKVAEAALPSLQALADILASPKFAQGAQSLGVAVIDVLVKIAEGAANAANNIRMIADALGSVSQMSSDGLSGRLREIGLAKRDLDNLIVTTQSKLDRGDDLFGINRGALEAQITKAKDDITALIGQEQEILAILKQREDRQAVAGGVAAVGGVGAPAALNMPTFNNEAASQALAQRLETLRQSLMSEEQAEIDSHAKRLAEIQKFYADGAISKQEQDSLIEAAQQQHADRMTEIAKKQVEEETRLREQLVGNVAGIFGSLSTIAESFGEKGLAAAKAFGVAEAIVNTAQGITKALAQGGIFGFVGAAAVAAAGAAQISTILSATKGSTSKPSVKGSSGASTSAPAVNNPVTSDTGTTVNLTLQGGGRYSRNELEALFRDMNDAMGDGLKLNVVGA